jgi:hypothetical protein
MPTDRMLLATLKKSERPRGALNKPLYGPQNPRPARLGRVAGRPEAEDAGACRPRVRNQSPGRRLRGPDWDRHNPLAYLDRGGGRQATLRGRFSSGPTARRARSPQPATSAPRRFCTGAPGGSTSRSWTNGGSARSSGPEGDSRSTCPPNGTRSAPRWAPPTSPSGVGPDGWGREAHHRPVGQARVPGPRADLTTRVSPCRTRERKEKREEGRPVDARRTVRCQISQAGQGGSTSSKRRLARSLGVAGRRLLRCG